MSDYRQWIIFKETFTINLLDDSSKPVNFIMTATFVTLDLSARGGKC